MNSLENQDHKNRLQLFFVVSMAAYFFWFSQLEPPVQQPVDGPVAEQVKEGEGTTVVEKPPIIPETPPENVQKVVYQTLPYDEGAFHFDITSTYGSPQFVGLRDFTVLPTIQSWWGWIFSGMEGSWTPYTESEEELKLLTKEGALLVVGEGDTTFKDVFNLTKVDSRTYVSVGTVNGVQVSQKITLPKSDVEGIERNTIDIEINISNQRSEKVSEFWIGTMDKMDDESADRFTNASRPQFYVEEELVGTFGSFFGTSFLSLEDLEEPTKFDSSPEWFGIGSRYFLSALYPTNTTDFSSVSTRKFGEGEYGVVSTLSQPIDSGATRTVQLKAFVGSKQMDQLEQLGESWTEAVEFGIFGFFSRVLLFMLKMIQAGFVNWGVSILLLTLVVKVIFFPLTQKAFLSGKKMQALQPKLKELKEKYKDNAQLQGQETMKLFTEHNVSPLGGCLPTFIQIPVWFSLYNVMLYSVELYDSQFLYLQDLTSADPYGILAIMYCVLMFIQQRMMPMGSMDPAQQQMLKLMPLIFGVFMFTFPSGLVLYFSMNILLTIFQQWLIRVQYDDKTLLQEAK
jgi:YidC/Oxa1 family membrane protein insertase